MDARGAVDRVLGRVEMVGVVLPVLALPVVLGLSMLDRGRRRVRRDGADAGVSVLEWVLISALVITIAGIVGAVILTKTRDKANELDLTTP